MDGGKIKVPEIIEIEKGEHPLIKWIKEERIAKNRNVNIIITGNPGTGKTMSGLTIAKSLSPNFDLNYIATGMEGLINILLEVIKDPDKYVGTVVVYEEPQEEQYKMRSNTVEAVSFVQILSTFRSLRLILVMTTPRQGHFQKEGRDYFDIWLETQGIDEEKELCFLKPKFGFWSEVSRKMFWEYLRVEYEDNIYVNSLIATVLPPKTIIKFYENTKLKFQKDSYTDKLQKIKTKYQSIQPKETFPHICLGKCQSKWNARVQTPARCPFCGSRNIKANMGGTTTS